MAESATKKYSLKTATKLSTSRLTFLEFLVFSENSKILCFDPNHKSLFQLPFQLNHCVHPKAPVTRLNERSLVHVINKYYQDICADDVERAFLAADDVEPYLKYKYPLLRLKYICDRQDYFKKQYVLTSLTLYHCCVSSINGKVDNDICAHLDKGEQELVLKFCEHLTDMEITCNNVECAIKYTCEEVKLMTPRRRLIKRVPEKSISTVSEESAIPSDSTLKQSSTNSLTSDPSQKRSIKFKSSITILPAAATDPSSLSELAFQVHYGAQADLSEHKKIDHANTQINLEGLDRAPQRDFIVQSNSSELAGNRRKVSHRVTQTSATNCQPECACTRCSPMGASCGDPGGTMAKCVKSPDLPSRELKVEPLREKLKFNWQIWGLIFGCLLVAGVMSYLSLSTNPAEPTRRSNDVKRSMQTTLIRVKRKNHPHTFVCKDKLCQKVYHQTSDTTYVSFSRCVLECMGPQLWPHPIGFTFFTKQVIALATNKLEYKFQSVPSEAVHSYLAEAFKLFIANLAELEKISLHRLDENDTDLFVRKMNIQIDVESDADPRMRVNTDESYNLRLEVLNNQVVIRIASPSFCGVRHGLETLSQTILVDETTGYLITLSNIIIKDAPSYRYRGLMLDTGRNYIPVSDILRTIDAMSTCKLNTFHWRISDVTSFPLLLEKVSMLFEYGAYSRNLVYTKEDVKAIVKRAGVRGIRVLIEVAAPGPVGRAWSWSTDASCPTKTENFTCNNMLCLRLSMRDTIMNILEIIYREIIEMTRVDDVFHLSDSLFSMVNCYYLEEEREGFLEKALARLKVANKGFVPKLPIVWYTAHLSKDFEARSWDMMGVQLSEWQQSPSDQFLSRFKVIHSSKWDLSCDIKKQRCRKYRTWQEMYSWKSWRNLEVFTIEGGESILWTDLVDSSNLDYHLWPRAAAVAERLWSDIALNGSVSGNVYMRLDHQRCRMLVKLVKVQPIWPMYCSFNPQHCLRQIKSP
ncbi:putative beta-hexosaminidase fdl [Anticarsia gemmatalis]|uniref:putative beta-hexosaminidase fdl n=1 Tax=Anticarsia gemmatalis TaxID=129554 RepID=UPI003F77759A